MSNDIRDHPDYLEGVQELKWTLGGLAMATPEFRAGWNAAIEAAEGPAGTTKSAGSFTDGWRAAVESITATDGKAAILPLMQEPDVKTTQPSAEFQAARVELQLARMRTMLKEAPSQHRSDGGQYVSHPSVSDHTELLAHMATEHGLAILPQHRTSTRSAQAAHLVAHQTETSE
jgi:hypothetical protein